MDGIDGVLVALGEQHCEVVHSLAMPYDEDLRRTLLLASRDPRACNTDDIGDLDQRIGAAFRDAALCLLRDSKTSPGDVSALGSHGQTLRHQPAAEHPYTLQLGDPNVIAAGTGITTVADFRRRDMALGGQGAPLTPGFHQWLFADPQINRVVLNIGGFANITVLGTGPEPVLGFDTGPGNSLLDAWCRRHRERPYDEGGAWAASGRVLPDLLQRMLRDEYFRRPPPKSTGFEYFDDAWLAHHLSQAERPADVQATLCELSVRSIADAIAQHAPATDEVIVCGGGAANTFLMKRLAARLGATTLRTTGHYGIGPQWIEAAAFAWLAMRCLDRQPGNLPSVTGARAPAVLGGIFYA